MVRHSTDGTLEHLRNRSGWYMAEGVAAVRGKVRPLGGADSTEKAVSRIEARFESFTALVAPEGEKCDHDFRGVVG